MSEELQAYVDVGPDLDEVKERLLNSLLELPETCFFRRTPIIITEKQFKTDEVLHKAYYRYVPVPLKTFEESVAYGVQL